jgi:DNA-binding MarR family transcriptional regulator
VSRDFELAQQIGYLIRRAGKSLSTAWADTEPGLTIPQFTVLLELDRCAGLAQRVIAERAWIDTSTIADTCRRLEANGYIRRERDPSDARRNRLFITTSGRAALAASLTRIPEVEQALMRGLSASERSSLLRILRKAVEA